MTPMYDGQVVDRSARRREKSRDAARCRRQQESDTYNEICSVIPVPSKVLSQMDRSSVMRLLISFMKLRKVVERVPEDKLSIKQETGQDIPSDDEFVNALNGFLIVLSHDCDLLYVSSNVKQYIGINSLDLIGQNLFGYTHEGDHGEITKSMKRSGDLDSNNHSFFMRMKSTLTPSGKNVNLKSATYKVLKCDGVVNHSSEKSGTYMVAYCEPIPHPSNIEMVLDSNTFLSQHSLDMKFTFCDDERVVDLLGYVEKDVVGRSFYSLCHTVDLKSMESSMQKLFRLGQVTTDRYRMLAKHGGYVWAESQATIINNPRNQQPSYIVCVHYIISDVLERDLVMSAAQMVAAQSSPLPTPVVKRELDVEEECAHQDSSESVFFDSTNSIFCDVDVMDSVVDVTDSLINDQAPPNNRSIECMAQNAPSIGDKIDFSQIPFSELFTAEQANNMCNGGSPIGDPQWNCQTIMQEGKMADIFNEMNMDRQQDYAKTEASNYKKPYMSPHRRLGMRSPPVHQSPQYSFSLPMRQLNQSEFTSPKSSPPPPHTTYQVVRVPRSQYQQQVLHKLPKRQHAPDIMWESKKMPKGIENFPCSMIKKPRLLPQIDGAADCTRNQNYTGRNMPDAAKLLLNGKYSQSNLAALLLNPGDKAGVFCNSPLEQESNSPYQLSESSGTQNRIRKSLLPELSLHDCEVNAPVNDNFSTVDWMNLSSVLCI